MNTVSTSVLKQQFEGARLSAAAYGAGQIKELLASNPSAAVLASNVVEILKGQGFTPGQANSFIEKYTPVAALNQDGAGAVIFRDNATGEIAIAVRGTNPKDGFLPIESADALADGSIALNKLPAYQTALIANFVLRETTPAGQAVPQVAVQGIGSSLSDLVQAGANALAVSGNVATGTQAGNVMLSQVVQAGTVLGTGRALGQCADAAGHSEGGPEVTVIGSALAQCSRITTVNAPGVGLTYMQSLTDQVTNIAQLPPQNLATQNQLNVGTTGISFIDGLNGGLPGTNTTLNIPTELLGMMGSHSSIVAMNAAEVAFTITDRIKPVGSVIFAEPMSAVEASNRVTQNVANGLSPDGREPLGQYISDGPGRSHYWQAMPGGGAQRLAIENFGNEGSRVVVTAFGKGEFAPSQERQTVAGKDGIVSDALLKADPSGTLVLDKIQLGGALPLSSGTSAGANFTPLPSTGVEGNSYTIQSGDSLWKIGKRLGLTDSETAKLIADVDASYKAQNLSGNVNDLKPGNTLALPDWVKARQEQSVNQEVAEPDDSFKTTVTEVQSVVGQAASALASEIIVPANSPGASVVSFTPIPYTLPDGTSGIAFAAPDRPALITTETGDQYTVGIDGQVTWLDPTPPGNPELESVAYRPGGDADGSTAATTPGETDTPATAGDSTTTAATTPLDSITPYAQGINSALTLIQSLQQGNTLSAVLAGASLANTVNQLATGGTAPIVPGDLTAGLAILSTGLNLLDALDAGDELGALAAGTNLASQAASLWASSLASQAGQGLVSQTAVSEAAALSSTLGNIAGAFNIVNSLAHHDPIGVISAVLMMNPATAPLGIAISIGRAILGGLLGDDEGEPAYVWVKASGDAQFIRTDTGIEIHSSGTNEHKSTEGSAVGTATQGGQAVATALGELLSHLQSQIATHNAAHPDAPLALVPERLPQLHWRDPAWYAEWTDANSGEARSLAVGRATLAEDLLAVAQSGQAVVPQWQADSISQRLEHGQADAWRAAPVAQATGDTQSQDILVLGGGKMDQTVRSDVDGDGWLEAHGWNTRNLYLALDRQGDGQITGRDDLLTLGQGGANSLGWLDANGDGKLDRSDPGFAALKVWLDANGDALAQDNELTGIGDAHVVAIDFRSNPPQLSYSDGSVTALTEAQLRSDTRGIRAQATAGGILLAQEAGETVLLATRTTDYTGDAAHTHGAVAGTAVVGDGKLVSLEAEAAPVVTTRLEAGDGRIKQGATTTLAATPAVTRLVTAADIRSLGVAPPATVREELRTVTSQMIQDAENLFVAGGGLLTAMALGAGSAQAGTLPDVLLAAALPEVEATVVSLPAAPMSRIGETLPTMEVTAVTSHASLPTARENPVVRLTRDDIVTTRFAPTAAPAPEAGPLDIATLKLDAPSWETPAAPSLPRTSGAALPATAPATLAADSPADGASSDSPPPPRPGNDALDDRLEDRAFRISPALLLANDGTGSPLSLVAVGGAEHGRVERLADGDIAFTPEADYFGTAAFTYTVADDFGQTAQARVDFTIRPVNDAPSVAGETVAATEDTTLLFDPALLLANDGDVDNPHADLRLTAVSGASHGSVTLQGDGTIRYTPEADFQGVAGFDYTVTDGAGGEARGHVTLTLAATNDAPVAGADALAATEDTPLRLDPAVLLANDRDVDNAHADLHILAVGNASHGSVMLEADGGVLFTPEADYRGAAGFDYTVTDGSGGSAQGHVALTVANKNDAPVTGPDRHAATEDAAVFLDPAALLANDSDVDTPFADLRLTAVGNASHGSVVLQADGSIRFTPDADYSGAAGFDYTVADGAGGQAQGHVDLDVAPVNDAPVAALDTFAATEDTPQRFAAATLLANDSDVDNARADLQIVAVGGARHGTVALLADGDVRFTPDADYFGAAGFDYTVEDGAGGTALGHVALMVANVNDAPLVPGESVASDEDVLLLFTPASLLAGIHDVDSPDTDFSIVAVGGASHGSVALLADGTVAFTPEADYTGPAGFDYTVTDGAGGSSTAHVDIALAPVNDAPVAATDSLAAIEDADLRFDAATLLANDSDVDNAHADLRLTAVGAASHGTVAREADGSIRFTPDTDYFGSAGFDYTVTDGIGGATLGHVELTVANVNDAPVAADDSLAAAEDTPLALDPALLLANDGDIDNAPAELAVVAVFNASHGAVSLAADGRILFTPEADYQGTAGFDYTLADGAGGTAGAHVELAVAAVNDAPVAVGESAAGTEDTALLFAQALLLANDSDIDNAHAELAIAAVDGASHGSVALQADGKVRFTPDADYVGMAGFDYTVADGAGGTALAHVEIAIAAVNDAPAVAGESAAGTEDTALLFDPAALLANDADVDNAHADLRLTAVGGAGHGTVTLLPDGKVRFIPEADYNGVAGFDYTVSDGAGGTALAHVDLAIAAVNDTPVVVGESVDTAPNMPLVFDPALLLANDTDVDDDHASLAIATVGGATHGTVARAADGTIHFTPETGYLGMAGFDYTVADGTGATALGHVTVNVAHPNHDPVVTGESVAATEDVTLLFDPALLLANDSDEDNAHANLVIAAVGGASHGSVALQADGKVRFTPDANYHGTAGFDYTVEDGAGGTARGRVELAVAAVNDAPVVTGERVDSVEDEVLLFTQAALLANDTDIDDDHAALRLTAVDGASHGAVALLADGSVRFTPEANWSGAAGFDYTVADPAGAQTRGHVDFAIAAVNDLPLVGNETVTFKSGKTFSTTAAALLANDSDAETSHSSLTVTTVGGASHGVATLGPGGAITFKSETGYVGAGGFDYTVSDGTGGAAIGHVDITLVPNVAPTAVDDGFTGYEDIPFVIAQSELLANDSDVDNIRADLSVTAVVDAANGTVALQDDGSIRFTPTANYYGAASFTYTVSDGDGGQTRATAYLNVQSVNDAPVIVATPVATEVDPLGTYSSGRINAYDLEGDALTYVLERAPVHGYVTMNAHVDLTWTPYSGTDLFVPDPGNWVYLSTFGDPYAGADPFEIKVVDALGGATTAWIEATHVGTTAGGGGGGGGCPIAIDLDRDGVELVAPDDSRVFADVNGDGWRERIGWVGNDDGLLALDRDGDGRIGGFEEISFARDLPGTHTDLEGLRAHDSDGDGFISAADTEWSRFGIWRDANGNGMEERGEFRSLDEMGVERIGLVSDGHLRMDHGNVVFGETRVELVSGETLAAADVMFAGAGMTYPEAVRDALDEAELSRRAQAFVQACSAATDDISVVGFVVATDVALLAPTTFDWHIPHDPALLN